MTENASKSLRFNTMPVITTRFGRKRGTLECGLHDVACVANVIGEGEGRAPNSLIFSCFPRSPSLFPDVFCESLFFQIKLASAVKRSRTVALSAERVLQSLEQKGDGNDGMSSGEESENVRIKSRGLKHPYEAQENESGEREEAKRTGQHGDNAARQICTATLSPAAFRDPSIALSCRVRARERATKKDQGRFIRTRAARARILRVGAYQASCGGKTFFKSGLSPVQFNYQPLLESISAHRRESWDAVRDASMIRARGGSLNMAHSVSSNGQIGGGDSGVRDHEPLEGLSHEQHANEFNSAQDDVDGGHGKREGEIETENVVRFCNFLREIRQMLRERSENSKNSKDSNADLTASNANVQKNGHVESNDRSQVHAQEEEKRETVSDLVNAWNNRTAEVLDV